MPEPMSANRDQRMAGEFTQVGGRNVSCFTDESRAHKHGGRHRIFFEEGQGDRQVVAIPIVKSNGHRITPTFGIERLHQRHYRSPFREPPELPRKGFGRDIDISEQMLAGRTNRVIDQDRIHNFFS